MREDLLGYLLSALEPHEMRRVEHELCDNPSLQAELAILQQTLDPLDRALAVLPLVESPPDLVARTMAMVPLLKPPAADVGTMMAPATVDRRSRLPTWSDICVAGLASAAVLACLIPGIARGRYEARRIACQENLRQVGTAITQYVMLNRHESLPQIAESGPESFAGMYAVRLNDSGLLPVKDVRWCPEGDMSGIAFNPRQKNTYGDSESVIDRLVHLDDLHEASESGKVDELRWLQQVAGGNYAYTLGVVDEDRYAAPHYESRATFAVLGDSPIAGTETADGVDASKLRWGHRDNGANVLFEDGSVQFRNISSEAQVPDHPFFNHRGAIEAGVNIDDASLAPSWRPPFISVRQR